MSALPKIIAPEFSTQLPIENKLLKYRVFLVGEEKLLLTAKQSDSIKDKYNTIIKICSDCCLDKTINVSKLPAVDFQWYFIQLCSKSLNNVIDIKVFHPKDSAITQTTQIDLENDVKISRPENHTNIIDITKDIKVEMKYLNINDFSSIEIDPESIDSAINLLKLSIKSIIQGNEIYDNFTENELSEWIDSLNKNQLKKMVEFFETMPQLQITKKIIFDDKEEVTLDIGDLIGFFL